MTNCPTCEQKITNHDQQKREIAKAKARNEAKRDGLVEFAIVKTKNANPGYMWRPIDHPDCERIGVEEYCVVY